MASLLDMAAQELDKPAKDVSLYALQVSMCSRPTFQGVGQGGVGWLDC